MTFTADILLDQINIERLQRSHVDAAGVNVSNYKYSDAAERSLYHHVLVPAAAEKSIVLSDPSFTVGCDSTHDFAVRGKRFEVKITKSSVDGGKRPILVEVAQRGRSGQVVPSGLSITEADVYLLVYPDKRAKLTKIMYSLIPVDQLRNHLSAIPETKYFSKTVKRLMVGKGTPFPDKEIVFATGTPVFEGPKIVGVDLSTVQTWANNRVIERTFMC